MENLSGTNILFMTTEIDSSLFGSFIISCRMSPDVSSIDPNTISSTNEYGKTPRLLPGIFHDNKLNSDMS